MARVPSPLTVPGQDKRVASGTVLRALKKYGMIVADNGGDWFVSGAPDSRWKDEELATLKRGEVVTE